MVLPKCKDLQEAAPVGRNQVALVIFAQNDREGVHVSVKRYRETLQEGGDWRVFECSSRRKGEGGGPPKCGFSCRQLPSVGESQALELDASFLSGLLLTNLIIQETDPYVVQICDKRRLFLFYFPVKGG